MTVYLVSEEAKNRVSLEAIRPALVGLGLCPIVLDIVDDILSNEGQVLSQFVADEDAVAVYASAFMKSSIDAFRGNGNTYCIGVEHGIAPFKSYTFGKHLLFSDKYIAPTKFWFDRLFRLYPDHASKLYLGGYPRISALCESMKFASQQPPAALSRWGQSDNRDAFLMSWGVSQCDLERLPDLPSIVYIFHPADPVVSRPLRFKQATVIRSTPEAVAYVLKEAHRIFGDFSSLSLEAISLGIPIYFVLDRKLYLTNCDIEAGFFDRGSDKFAVVPHSDVKFSSDEILDIDDLYHALTGRAVSKSTWNPPPEMLCPGELGDAKMTVDAIHKILVEDRRSVAKKIDPESLEDAKRRILFAQGVAKAYIDVLGRKPDLFGLINYVNVMEQQQGSITRRALKVIDTLVGSPEAKLRFSGNEWPRIKFV